MAEDTSIQIVVPPEHQTGAYSNFAVISHQTEHDFTLDFCQIVPGQGAEGPTAVVVARVKAAPSFLFPLMQSLSQNLDQFERNIKRTNESGEDGEEQ